MQGLSILNSIVKELEEHPNSRRIKKLVFYACKNSWENDISRLNQYQVCDLVQELKRSHPTIEQLSYTLHELVQTLNRQSEYALVANTIIIQLSKLYNDSEESTQVVFAKPNNSVSTTEPPSIFEEIARELEQEENSIRIKKLIFYVCQDRWENNPNILERVKLADLIQELTELHQTIEQLSSALHNQVETLNRQAEYFLVANTIISKLESLYDESLQGTYVQLAKTTQSTPQPPPTLGGSKSVLAPCPDYATPTLGGRNREQEASYSIPSNVEGINQTPALSSPSSPNSPNFSIDNKSALEVRGGKSAAESTQDESVNLGYSTSQLTSEQDERKLNYDRFDLRVEVMKYTNPLRAKILVFSAVHHPFKATQQDWLLLRGQTFDDLLFELVSRYKTFQELEAKLYDMASRFKESDENHQAAGAIARSLKPLYANL
ncbi:MAG TPA: hypothetical protein DDZ80_28295 [Cyanobacteria bacterium UBA8803]|nr:hypothetical protein [Cyanobacteria bacterium UBA8803]